MSLLDLFRRRFGPVVVIREANVDGTSDSEEDMRGWSRIGGAALRDFSPAELAKIRRQSAAAYVKNPYAKRAIDHMVGFVTGPGFQVRSWHPGFSEILEDHWEDPDNQWDLRQYDLVRDLSTLGEVFPRAFVGKTTGRVKWAFVDPDRVDRVRTAEENADEIEVVVVRNKGGTTDPLKAIRRAEKPAKNGVVPLEGEIFAFLVNRVRGQTRGLPDLTPVLDWLMLSDEFAWIAAERARIQQHVVWDLVIPGISPEEAKKLAKEVTVPDPRSVHVTSDKEAGWIPKVADLKSLDVKAMDDVIFRRIVAGTGFPPTWYGEGMDVNRAVGVVMGSPAFRSIMRRQRFVKFALEQMFNFVLFSAVDAAQIPPVDADPKTGEERAVDFEIICPEIATEDTNPRTTALLSLIQGLSLAKMDGALTDEQYRTLLLAQLDRDGYDLPEEQDGEAQVEVPPEVAAQLRAIAASKGAGIHDLRLAVEDEARKLRADRRIS